MYKNIHMKIPSFDNCLWIYDKTLQSCHCDNLCSCMVNYVLNCIQWIWMLGIFHMEYKTHVVVMEVVSQHLDEHKNNGLICKLQEILSGQIWVACLVWFFSKSWVNALTPKFLWFILDIQGSSSVKFHDNWRCFDSPFVFYKWSICC